MLNMNLETVVQMTDMDKKNSKDYVIRSDQIDIGNGVTDMYAAIGNWSFGINKYAHNQIAEKLGIPSSYYNKMLEKNELKLLTQNINTWLAKEPEKKRLVRVLDGNVRAFLSSRFRCIDNNDVLMLALQQLKGLNCEVKQCYLTDSNLYLKAVTPQIQGEVKVGDIVQQGIVLRNSEVGAGALRVEPMIWRLACSNGMIMATALKEIHIGRDMDLGADWRSDITIQNENKLILSRVNDIIAATFSGKFMDEYLEKAKYGASIEIKAPIELLDSVAVHFDMTDQQKKDILTSFINQKDTTMWGLSNSITAVAKEQDNIDEQIRLEEVGYKTLSLQIPKLKNSEFLDFSGGVQA